jgi:hypothetical protein
MEAIETQMKNNPAFREEYERKTKEAESAAQRSAGTARTSTLTGPVTIPVVVHVVLPNPNMITETQIDYFLNRLNLDYSGLNPDSANGAPFYGVRGHSLIRFTRARRDPNGNLTTGVERLVGTATITQNTYQPIKHSNQSGLDPWDVTKYYNVWVGVDGSGAGLLGIAPGIGVGGQTETTSSTTGIDGVCINYVGFSNGCFSDPAYNLARTVVHEIGHNFGLFHTFSGCATGADFAQLTPTGQTLPTNLLASADDTPSLSTATTNCPSGTVASNCSGVTSKMYQDYMDYTADACYSMFTKGQVARMEYVLENFRSGYLTSNGATPPPSATLLDIAPIYVVSPGGNEANYTTCTNASYPVPTCPGAFIPKVSVINNGASTITTLTATVTVNGVTSAPVTVNGLSLLTGASVTVTFPSQNLISGANTIKFTTSAPNGGTDQLTTNDNLTSTITIANAGNLPISQNFVSTAFPPANLTINNPDGNITWVRNANGNGNAGSIFIDNYDYSTGVGQFDDFIFTPVNVGTGNTNITFDLAHKAFPSATFYDTLSVQFSKDCGQTYTTVYKKWGPTGATALGTGTTPTSSAGYTTPAASDWRNESIALTNAQTGSDPILIRFRNSSRYGNNIFIDNINVSASAPRDLKATGVISPIAGKNCTASIIPSFTIQNAGTEAITSYTVGYSIDGVATAPSNVSTTLAVNASTTYTFAPSVALTAGSHIIKMYTGSPVSASGNGDLNVLNDTISRTFTIANLLPLPFTEDFEGTWSGTPAAPAGWSNISTNGQVTWVKKTPGRNSNSAAFFDNYNNNIVGALDYLVLPYISNTYTVAPDSVIFSFDVAYKDYTGSNDRLRVLASTNCATSFTSIYSKAGATLATAGSSTADYTTPIAADWRRDRIALADPYTTSNSLVFELENLNDYGNNLFVDNINIQRLFSKDLELTKVANPEGVLCSSQFTPQVVVKNTGSSKVTGFVVSYTLNGGTAVSTTFSNLNLLRDSSLTLTLTSYSGGTLSAGNQTLKFYTSALTTVSGNGDVNNSNDTIVKTVSYTPVVTLPLNENFENVTTLPPSNWGVVNADGLTTWSKATVGKASNGSATVKNSTYTDANGQKDALFTPQLSYGTSVIDSLFLKFDIAAATKSYPGSTFANFDTLEVLVTKDCGITFSSVYKKWGAELQTLNDPNNPYTFAFTPASDAQWRTDTINLTSFASSGPIQIAFRNTSNGDNNIYIDNVNVTSKTLSPTIKTNGFMIVPNPVKNIVTIQHYTPPTNLRGIGFYNSLGQRLMYQSYNGNADSYLPFDISRFAAGVYTIKLEYTTKTISQRIIKL